MKPLAYLPLTLLSLTTLFSAFAQNYQSLDLELDPSFDGMVLVSDYKENIQLGLYGFSDRGKQIKTGPETVYDVGSIAKHFTKAAILKLTEQDKLRMNTPLSELFESIPADKKEITVEQLINHTSGLNEYIPTPEQELKLGITFHDHGRISKQEVLHDYIFKQTLDFEPGTSQQYSNTGYTLLAAIVEEVTDGTFQEFVKKEIFDIVGLKQTGFYADNIWSKDQLAIGRSEGNVVFMDNDPTKWPSPSWMLLGSGAIISSPADLNRLMIAFSNGEIIKKATYEKYYRAGAFAGGNMYGFITFVATYPDADSLIIVTSNSSSNDGYAKKVLAKAKCATMPDECVSTISEDMTIVGQKFIEAFNHSHDKAATINYMRDHFTERIIKANGLESLYRIFERLYTNHGAIKRFTEHVNEGEYTVAGLGEKTGYYIKFVFKVKDGKVDHFNPFISDSAPNEGNQEKSTGVNTDNSASSFTSLPVKNWGLPSGPYQEVISAFLTVISQKDERHYAEFVNNAFASDFRNLVSIEEHVGQFKQMNEQFGDTPSLAGVLIEHERRIKIALQSKSMVQKMYFNLDENFLIGGIVLE